jgi:hypothetical protein
MASVHRSFRFFSALDSPHIPSQGSGDFLPRVEASGGGSSDLGCFMQMRKGFGHGGLSPLQALRILSQKGPGRQSTAAGSGAKRHPGQCRLPPLYPRRRRDDIRACSNTVGCTERWFGAK